MAKKKGDATLTRLHQILRREGLTPQEVLDMDIFEALRIPDLGKRTYLCLREHYGAQAFTANTEED